MTKRKRVLSCIQPTGDMHIGNYFGAVKNWVELQSNPAYDCVFGVVDLHAMTMPYDTKALQQSTFTMAAELLACGIDPAKAVLFVQSLVPQHVELAWVLGCATSYGELHRMTQFKEKSDQLGTSSAGKFVSAGLFTYPILQAADILIYKAEFVPVGKDQEQHLELTRNIAQRFNQNYGEIFPEPKPLFTPTPKILSLADPTKKMSKSLGPKHYVGLFEDEASVRKKVRSAVTDSGDGTSPGVDNLFAILRCCGRDDVAAALEAERAAATLKYSALKDAAADALVELTSRLRARREEMLKDTDSVKRMIGESSARARELAEAAMKEVRPAVGMLVC